MSCLQSQILLKTPRLRNRRDRMLADEAEARLIFSRRRVFHPEQTIVFNTLPKRAAPQVSVGDAYRAEDVH